MRIVYSDHRSTFEELVEGDKTFSIHHKNIQSLFIEIYNFLVRQDEQRFSFKENNRFSLRNAYERLHLFLQNKYKKMETRLPMPALQEIFVTYWFCLKVNFISSVTQPYVKSPIQSLVKPLEWSFL